LNRFQVRKVAVLGAGVMGAQIAAHLANANVKPILFDLPAAEGKDKSAIARKAIDALGKLEPSPLATKGVLAQVTPANYDEHLGLLKDCDLVIEAATGPEAIVNSSERIEAFDPETGKSLWQYNLPHRFAVPMPVFHNGTIYLNRGYRSSPILAIRPGGRGDITNSHVAWNVGAGAPYVSSLIYDDGLLFYVTEQGIATCIDAKSGDRVWQDRVGGVYSTSPIAADGKVYLFGENGEAIVLKPGRTAQVLARNKLDGRIIGSPAVSAGRIFVRTDRQLIAIQAK
jgi:outer membrane protein assembly factor BamB